MLFTSILEVFGSVISIIVIKMRTNVTQIISIIDTLYSPWILRRPKPTLKPVNVSAHMIPATLNISLAISKIYIL